MLIEIAPTMIAAMLLVTGAGQAEANSCIKGSIFGGVAGHYPANRGSRVPSLAAEGGAISQIVQRAIGTSATVNV